MRELAFGIPLPPAHAQPPPLDEICTQIGAALANIVEKPKYAPRRPMQLPKLMRAINDETASRGELSQIIAGDPALAGNLLRLANSPFYRHGREPIESLDHAVAILGIEGLRSMIAAALLQPVFRTSGGSFAHFGEITWEHSLYAAGAAEGHASLIDNADPFAAQLLALVLGLATIVVFSLSRDMYLAHQKLPAAATLAGAHRSACDLGRAPDRRELGIVRAHRYGAMRAERAGYQARERAGPCVAIWRIHRCTGRAARARRHR